jgi:putative addiction module component (TIGR02574 family)
MTTKAIREKVFALPVREKLLLVQALWDSIAADADDVKLSDDEGKLLDERVKAYRRNPAAAQPWNAIRRRALSKLRKSHHK